MQWMWSYGQLAWSLRSDPRVVCMERTNVRYLTAEQIPEPLDFRYSGCVLYLIKADFTRPTGYPKAGRTGSLSGEAPV